MAVLIRALPLEVHIILGPLIGGNSQIGAAVQIGVLGASATTLLDFTACGFCAPTPLLGGMRTGATYSRVACRLTQYFSVGIPNFMVVGS